MPSDQAFGPIPLGFISQLLILLVGCYRTSVISYFLTAAAMSSAQRQVQLLFFPGDLPIGCCTAMHIGFRKTFSLGQNPDAGRQHDGFTQTTYLDCHFAHMEGGSASALCHNRGFDLIGHSLSSQNLPYCFVSDIQMAQRESPQTRMGSLFQGGHETWCLVEAHLSMMAIP
jgi:hypothetical protein